MNIPADSDVAPISVVWVNLDQPTSVVDDLHLTLSDDEQRRVARFSTPLLQRRAIVTLAQRRQVVADFCNASPEQVSVTSHETGEPFATDPDGEPLTLSTSHCNDVGLMAITRRRRVGVDVESALPALEENQFASWVATENEARQITSLEPSHRLDAYLRLWTRKEAYLKATGEGIGDGFLGVEVPIDSEPWGQSFRPVADGPAWSLFELSCPRPDLRGALVISKLCDDESIPVIEVTHR